MKIRNGFVSNSSSSSFIIDGNKFTCVEIALKMTRVLYEDDQDGDNYKIIVDNLNKLENKNTNIFIDCSDDIRIARVDNKIYIEACNHYDWDCLESIEEYGDECEYYNKMQDAKYYFPLYDNKYLGKLVDSDSRNNTKYKNTWIYRCHTRYIELENGIIFCPKCLKDPDGNSVQQMFREDKLNRILKNED